MLYTIPHHFIHRLYMKKKEKKEKYTQWTTNKLRDVERKMRSAYFFFGESKKTKKRELTKKKYFTT